MIHETNSSFTDKVDNNVVEEIGLSRWPVVKKESLHFLKNLNYKYDENLDWWVSEGGVTLVVADHDDPDPFSAKRPRIVRPIKSGTFMFHAANVSELLELGLLESDQFFIPSDESSEILYGMNLMCSLTVKEARRLRRIIRIPVTEAIINTINKGRRNTLLEPIVVHDELHNWFKLVSKISELDVHETQKIANILNYIFTFPSEYQFVAFFDICKLPKMAAKVAKSHLFSLYNR